MVDAEAMRCVCVCARVFCEVKFEDRKKKKKNQNTSKIKPQKKTDRRPCTWEPKHHTRTYEYEIKTLLTSVKTIVAHGAYYTRYTSK